MTRNQALPYVSFCVDDALSERKLADMPSNARLVGWQCGFEPLFVAVWSYLDVTLDDDEAAEIATDLLAEKKWFAGEPTSLHHLSHIKARPRAGRVIDASRIRRCKRRPIQKRSHPNGNRHPS